MSVQTLPRLMTAEEFAFHDCGERVELIKGEIVPMPPSPGAEHGYRGDTLSSRASVYAQDNDLGYGFMAETGFLIERGPDTVKGPDWAFVAKERLPSVLPQGYLPLAPDLVLEVRSPSTSKAEAEAKMQIWMDAGVRLGWELDPKTQTLTVYRPNQAPRTIGMDGTIDGEDVLPGFTFPVRRLF